MGKRYGIRRLGTAAKRARQTLAVTGAVAVVAIAALSCSSDAGEPERAQAPEPTVQEPTPTPAPTQTPAPTAVPAATVTVDKPQLVLDGEEFSQAGFPDEAAQLAIEVLGEPTRSWCREAVEDSCRHEWDLLDHTTRFQIDDGGWVLWGEPLVTSIDERMTFETIDGDPTDITTITTTDPYQVSYNHGQPSRLCSLTLCFSAAAGNAQYGPEDAARITVIFDRTDTVQGRATVIGDEPVPFDNEPSPAYTVTPGQELWVRSGFQLLGGTYWVEVITDDHRGFAIPMDRLMLDGETVDMLTTYKNAREARTAQLIELYGPVDVLDLRPNGLGPIDLGGSVDDAVAIAIAALGEPSYHAGSSRSTPHIVWSTNGGDISLRIATGVLSGWRVTGSSAPGAYEPSPGPLGAIASISLQGAALPLAASDLNLADPWGVEGTNPAWATIHSASGVAAETRDGLIIQLWTTGSSSVTESWFVPSAGNWPYGIQDLLPGLTEGERVWVDNQREPRDTGFVYAYTDDHRAGWVFHTNLTTEQP